MEVSGQLRTDPSSGVGVTLAALQGPEQIHDHTSLIIMHLLLMSFFVSNYVVVLHNFFPFPLFY